MQYFRPKTAFFFFALVLLQSLNAASFNHAKLDTLLDIFTSNGKINYAAVQVSPRLLDDYSQQLYQLSSAEYKAWSAQEKLAFWINAYNVMVIKGIVQHYPIGWGNVVSQARFPKNSIYQIKDFEERCFIKIKGENWTLNKIRKKIFMDQYNDPRIFLTIVTGQLGDPPIAEKAYQADQLEQQLDQAARRFISITDNVELDKKQNSLRLSELFYNYRNKFKINNTWQDFEKGRQDSLTRIKKDSVRETLPQKVVQLYQERLAQFKTRRLNAIERLEEEKTELEEKIDQQEKIIREIKAMAQEREKDYQPITSSKLNTMKDQQISEKIPQNSDRKSGTATNTPSYSTEAFADSLILFHQIKLDSLRILRMQGKDSLKRWQTAYLDSSQFYLSAYDSLLEFTMSKLDNIPTLELQHYDKDVQGIVLFLMNYFPAEVCDYIRENHPKLDFKPLDKNLNQVIY